jgi:NADH:ubiquinone oxidoreductase subunit 4 (subunit M)
VKPEFENAHIHDVHIPEYIAWVPLLVGILLFGIFPHLLFDIIDPAVTVVTHGVDTLGNVAAGGGGH